LRRPWLLVAGAAIGLAAIGCGGDEGVAEGATVTVYVAAPLCAEAKRELARHDGRAGEVRVRVACLENVHSGARLDLAAIGANARRATEDTTTVAYIESDPAATRFSAEILESADIPEITDTSGTTAMSKLLKALQDAGSSSSVRDSVRDELP
jgi:hypothetical protein